jgi:hypothetical protein
MIYFIFPFIMLLLPMHCAARPARHATAAHPGVGLEGQCKKEKIKRFALSTH